MGAKRGRRMVRGQAAANLSIVVLAAGVVLLFVSWVAGSWPVWLAAAACFGVGLWLLFGRVPGTRSRRK